MFRGSTRALCVLAAWSLGFQAATAGFLRSHHPHITRDDDDDDDDNHIKQVTDVDDDDHIKQVTDVDDDIQYVTNDGTFNHVFLGEIKKGSEENGCEDFFLSGPFAKIHIRMGLNTVRGLTAKSINQNETSVLAGAKQEVDGVEVIGGDFEFGNNERIEHFAVGVGSDGVTVRTVAFLTNLGNSFRATADLVRKGEVDDLTFHILPAGGGILSHIYGTSCATGEFGSIGFAMVGELESVVITDIDYEGFSNNVMPAEEGTPLTVGSMIFDNRNSSIEQRIVMVTSDTESYSRSIRLDMSYMFGNTLTVGGKVGVPLVSEGTVSLATTWSLSKATGETDTHDISIQRGAMYWLNCPPFKFCHADAFMTTYQLTVNMEATLTATTKQGGAWQWMQSGTYETADSQTLQFNVTEIDDTNMGVPITRTTTGEQVGGSGDDADDALAAKEVGVKTGFKRYAGFAGFLVKP